MILASNDTTIGEVCAQVAHLLDIDDPDIAQYLNLFASRDGSSPSSVSLHRDDTVLDARDRSAKLIFMISLLTAKIKESTNAVLQRLMFWQAQHNILSGGLVAKEHIILKLAALVFQGNYGAPSTTNHKHGFIGASRMGQYIPICIMAEHSPSEWERLITGAHGNLTSGARKKPYEKYLTTVKALHLYGYSTWKVKQHVWPDVPEQVLLSVGEKGIEITDLEAAVLHKTYAFNALFKWGFHPGPAKDFWFSTKQKKEAGGRGDELNMHEFGTAQGQAIAATLTDIARQLVATIRLQRSMSRSNTVKESQQEKTASATAIQTAWRAYAARAALDHMIIALEVRLRLDFVVGKKVSTVGLPDPPERPKSTFLVGLL
jgi:hypothetical protein